MSFSQFLKDYIDAINNFYDAYSGHINFLPFLQVNLIYLVQCIKSLIEYIITFRWVIDFCSVQIVIPQIMGSNFIEEYSLEDPMFRFFDFFELYNKHKHITFNPYLTGIFNSFFYCLPFSANNLYWLRRLTIEGIPGAIAAGLGIFVVQFFTLIGILFGLRFLIMPMFVYESLHYVVGVALTFYLICRTVNKPMIRVKAKEKHKLVKIFLFHLGFTWAENTSFFQYLSNVTFTPSPTIFEGVSSGGEDIYLHPIIMNGFYFLGILFGLVFWYTVFGAFFLWLGSAVSTFFNFTYSRWIRSLHYYSKLFLIAFAISSIGHYHVDYLATSPLGFTKDDEGAKQFHTKTYSKDWHKGRLGEYSLHTSYDTDPAPFDHGRYVSGKEVEQTFEDLNYQGEYAWRSRNDRLSVGSRGKVNRWIITWISTFKKTKAKGSQVKIPPANLDEKNPNRWKYFDIYSTIVPSFFSTREGLLERFLDDYQQDVSRSVFPDKKPITKPQDLPYVPFGELAKYGFDSFAANVNIETDEFEESLGRRMKRKFFNNYVYHGILTVDMSLFLSRQPKKHFLKADEENSLFKKRQILGSYYDSLREYSKLPYYEAYEELFLGPKSYANRVYNQQFKGTLKIVKRLFSISLENRQNTLQKSILKFDQPLYTYKNGQRELALHEELLTNLSDSKDQKPFLEEINPIPLYAGWDAELRKFSITNYLLPHSESSLDTEFYNNVKGGYDRIDFLNWPLSDSKLESVKHSPKPPLNVMFNVYDDPSYLQERDLFEYPIGDNLQIVSETLPSSIRRLDLRERDKVDKILRPIRGGYVWATNDPLKIKLKKDLLDYLPPPLRQKVRAKIREIRGWRS